MPRIAPIPRSRISNPNPPPRTNGRGQPTKYKPEYSTTAQLVCKLFGASSEELGKLFGVTGATVRNWKEAHRGFFLAIRNGTDEFNVNRTERALLESALGYEAEEVVTETTEVDYKDGRGVQTLPAIRRRITKRKHAPNVTACMFFLVNRTKHLDDPRWQNLHNIVQQISGSLNVMNKYDVSNLSVGELEQLRDYVSRLAPSEGNGNGNGKINGLDIGRLRGLIGRNN